jgi:DNA-binding transcriptional LysR family regulator
MVGLNGIDIFVRAAETSSFVAAGQRLGISASAVGKSIAKLEARLGVRLFHRTTRRLTLTEEGALFHDRCKRALEDLRDAEDILRETASQPRGRLRIGAPTIGYRFLLPVLSDFRSLYPDVQLEIDFNDRIIDVVEAGLDLVIRSGPLADSSLMSRRLGDFRFLLCAAPAYLARAGRPTAVEDLAAHACLAFHYPTTGRAQAWVLTAGGSLSPDRLSPVLTCNNMEALREAAICGLGLAYMPDFLARDALEDGRLRVVLGEAIRDWGQFTALWPSNRGLAPKVRVFLDHLGETVFPGS